MSNGIPAPLEDPAGPQLMIIDMQRIFGEPSSQWATPGTCIGGCWIQRLLGAFESTSVPHGSCHPISRPAFGSPTTRCGPLLSTL